MMRRCERERAMLPAGGGGPEIGIPLHGVRNERIQLRVAESADPVRHYGALRCGPARCPRFWRGPMQA